MKILSVLGLCLFSSSLLAQAVWTELRSEVIEPSKPTPGMQVVPLQLTIDANSPWGRAGEMRAQVEKASGIFRACGVEIGRVELRYVNYSQSTIDAINNASPYKGPGPLVLTQGEMSSTRPAVWLFNNQIASTAQAFNRTSIGRLSMGSPVDVRPLLHTSVITGHHHSNSPVPGANATYSTFAHELAHILGDIDHIDEANNLMSSRTVANSKSGRLNPQQCEKIRAYVLANFSNVGDGTAALTQGNLGNPPRGCQ